MNDSSSTARAQQRHKFFPKSACLAHLIIYNEPLCPNLRGRGTKVCRDHAQQVAHKFGLSTPAAPKERPLSRAEEAALKWEPMQTNAELQAEVNRLNSLVAELTALPSRKRAKHYAEQHPTEGTIYALLSGFNVKIGWTGRDLQSRLREYPPSTQLLVHYPGRRGDETRIKRRFAHLRTHGEEWFPYAPQVTEWVDQMVTEHGAPDASITCGPAKYEPPRPHAQKPMMRPKSTRWHVS